MTNNAVGGVTQQILNLRTELETLRTQFGAQGEQLSQEILERRAEVDSLKLELDTLKRFLKELNPDFSSRYELLYDEEREKFNPEKAA